MAAAAQAAAKGTVLSPCGNLGRRRGAVAAVRIGGSWSKTAFLGGRLAVGPRRSGSQSLVASPVQVNRDLFWGGEYINLGGVTS
jgi:hypothetical protein